MSKPGISPGQEAKSDEIGRMCREMYEAICCILYALNPYHSMDRMRVQKAIQTRKTIHKYIIELGKKTQTLDGTVMALGAADPESEAKDTALLREYYELLDGLYQTYSDIHSDISGAVGDAPLQWVWADSAEDAQSTLSIKDNYDSSQSSYTFRRAILHQAILDNQCEQSKEVPDDMLPCAIILVGGFAPASYQCTSALQERFGDLVQIDPEQIAQQIPECQKYIRHSRPSLDELQGLRSAAALCEDEVVHIIQLLLERATRRRYNMLLSGVGEDAKALKPLIRSLRKQKYRVSIVYLDQTLDKTKDRMQRHTAKTGFGLREEELQERYTLIEKNMESLTKLSPVFLLYNNNGEKPKPVWWKEGKKSKAFDSGYIEERGWSFLGEGS